MLDVEKIEKCMYDLRLNQAQLAERSGLSTSYISAIIARTRGRRVSPRTLFKLAKALEVKPFFLLKESTYLDESEKSTVRKSGEGEELCRS